LSELDTKYVDEALNYKKKAKDMVGLSGEYYGRACVAAAILVGVKNGCPGEKMGFQC
jgi:hypothetical protein